MAFDKSTTHMHDTARAADPATISRDFEYQIKELEIQNGFEMRGRCEVKQSTKLTNSVLETTDRRIIWHKQSKDKTVNPSNPKGWAEEEKYTN